MGMFKNTLLLAQQGNEKAMEKLLNRYDPPAPSVLQPWQRPVWDHHQVRHLTAIFRRFRLQPGVKASHDKPC